MGAARVDSRRPLTLARRPVTGSPATAILPITLRTLNPFAIGAGFGGLLLEFVAPRSKPRAGIANEPSLLSDRTVSRTPRSNGMLREHDRAPIASGIYPT